MTSRVHSISFFSFDAMKARMVTLPTIIENGML